MIFCHFVVEGHQGLLEDVSVTIIDRLNGSPLHTIIRFVTFNILYS